MVEHIVHIDGVTGSSPVATTTKGHRYGYHVGVLSFCIYSGLKAYIFGSQSVFFTEKHFAGLGIQRYLILHICLSGLFNGDEAYIPFSLVVNILHERG